MATTIVTKYGGDAPAASDIVRGELAVDTENGRLYTENAAGAVVEIGLNPEGNVDVTGTLTADGLTVSPSGTQQVLATLRANSGAGGGLVVQTDASDDGLIRGYDSSGAVQIQFDTDGGDNYIAKGNVGIGTSSPSTSLDVVRAGVQPLRLQNTSGTEVAINMVNTGGNVQLEAHSGNFSIDADAVGIGTSSPDSGYKLDVAGNVAFGDGGGFDMNVDGTRWQFSLGGSEKMRLDASGNLLVGKTSTTFSVVGVENRADGRITSTRSGNTNLLLNRLSSDGDIVQFYKDGTTVGSIATNSSRFELDGSGNPVRMKAGTSNIQVNNNTHISFDTAGGEAARFDASGNLLVGTTTASISATNNTGAVIVANGASQFSRDGGHTLDINRVQDGEIVRFRSAGNAEGSISISGSTTSYNTSSDQRLKENIVDAPSASDDIDAIQVRSFDWKADGSHQKYGMVAQELQTVAPEAVSGDADSEDMMGVDYSKLVPMMLKEIQSLRARIAALES